MRGRFSLLSTLPAGSRIRSTLSMPPSSLVYTHEGVRSVWDLWEFVRCECACSLEDIVLDRTRCLSTHNTAMSLLRFPINQARMMAINWCLFNACAGGVDSKLCCRDDLTNTRWRRNCWHVTACAGQSDTKPGYFVWLHTDSSSLHSSDALSNHTHSSQCHRRG